MHSLVLGSGNSRAQCAERRLGAEYAARPSGAAARSGFDDATAGKYRCRVWLSVHCGLATPPTDNVADERRRLTPTEQSLWWLHARAGACRGSSIRRMVHAHR